MIQIKNPLRFHYIKHPKVKSTATVATLVKDKNVIVAFAFCSPKDQFCKAIGRSIAEGRLAKSHLMVPFNERSFNAIADAWESQTIKKPKIWSKSFNYYVQ